VVVSIEKNLSTAMIRRLCCLHGVYFAGWTGILSYYSHRIKWGTGCNSTTYW